MGRPGFLSAVAGLITAGGVVAGASAASADTITVSVDDAEVTELGYDDRQGGDWDVDVTVRLSAPAAGKIAVEWTTTDGSAVAGSDYRAASGTLWIPGGVTSKVVPIELINDDGIEPDESFGFEIVSVTEPASIGDGIGEITIVDDDTVPTVIPPEDLAVVEGSGGGGARAQTVVDMTLRLSNPSDQLVKVHFGVGAEGDTAIGGWWGQRHRSDYHRFPYSLIRFSAGETERTVRLRVFRDDLPEADEVVTLTARTFRYYPPVIVDPANATTTVKILDDD